MFRAILTYHPNVGTFRKGRGAWRVQACYPVLASDRPVIKTGMYFPGCQKKVPVKALHMDVARRLERGTWTSPTKLLRELFVRHIPYDGVANRAQYEAECAHAALAETFSQPTEVA